MRWNKLKYVIRSEYGQDGVYFISDGQTKQVFKAPESPYSELFLTLLAHRFDLKIPEIKVIGPNNQQYEEIIRYIKPEIEKSNIKLREAQKQEEQKNEYEQDFEILEKRILNLDTSPTFFLMENLKGRSLRDITGKNFIDWYGTDEHLNGAGHKFFKDLGKLLVFDLLVRNVDRFIFWQLPGIGELESALGNIGNIFIRNSNSDCAIETELLRVLNARDALQTALKLQSSISTSELKKIIKLDSLLRDNALNIVQNTKSENFTHWRESFQPASSAWWWKLDVIAVHPWDYLDWLWKSLSLAGWTANISLLVNIATRFLGGGGVGLFGVAAVALPSILTLLQASSELTKAGGEGLEKLLDREIPIWGKKIPKKYHQETKLGLTLLMSGLLYGFWLLLPAISDIYNQNGLKNHFPQDGSSTKNLGEAEQDYQRAISLNPDNTDARYNLGNLYEEWQEIEKAKKEYQIAIAGNLPNAYNNLGRLYVLDKKYPQAAALLTKGLELEKGKNIDPEVKYSLHKNLGWVRFEQSRYKEAQAQLGISISLAETSNGKDYIPNPGAAYCLMAQVLEKQKEPKALEQWKKCAELGSTTNPDEDTWLHLAHEKLEKEGK